MSIELQFLGNGATISVDPDGLTAIREVYDQSLEDFADAATQVIQDSCPDECEFQARAVDENTMGLGCTACKLGVRDFAGDVKDALIMAKANCAVARNAMARAAHEGDANSQSIYQQKVADFAADFSLKRLLNAKKSGGARPTIEITSSSEYL